MSALGSGFAGVDNDRAVHAVGDVGEHGLRPAVVHVDAGVAGLEAERERLAGSDILEGDVGGDPRRVKVDRVRDRTAVHERHLDGLPLADVNDRAGGSVPVEGPGVVLHTRRHLDDHVLEGHLHLDQVARRHRRKRGVRGDVSLCELRRVLGNDAGEAVERERRVVVGRLAAASRRMGSGLVGCGHRTVGRGVALPGVGPHQEGEEAEDGNQEAQKDGGHLEEGAGVRLTTSGGMSGHGMRRHRFSLLRFA